MLKILKLIFLTLDYEIYTGAGSVSYTKNCKLLIMSNIKYAQ